MNTNKKPLSGEKSNGANDLINELNITAGTYAYELKNIREGKPLDDDGTSILVNEGAFKMFMELLKNVEKLKELAKITIPQEIESEIIDEPKIRGIQDFALNKKKIG